MRSRRSADGRGGPRAQGDSAGCPSPRRLCRPTGALPPAPTPLPSLLFPLANPRASLVARLVNNQPAMQEPGSIPGSGRFGGEEIGYPCQVLETYLVAKTVKNLPAMWETWVRSLGWEDPLEKGTAMDFCILARILWTVQPGGL